MDNFERCDYCRLMLQHTGILQNELTRSESESDNRRASILELKSYYWIIKAFYNKILIQCHCEYKCRFSSVLKNLLELFKENEVQLDADTAKCDICRILPCELFSLLDVACKLSAQQDLDSMYAELQYHIFISWIFNELIGECADCDAVVNYRACIEFTCKYLDNKDVCQLQEFVYFWKKATNTDEIWSCVDSLNSSEKIESLEVKRNNHITAYLDFNVYNRYEKEPKIAEFFKQLIHQEKIDVIYSATHLEEILRMENKEYEAIRMQSIQALTHGKIAVIGANDKIALCVEDIAARMKQVERYQKMNHYAEERACITAEAREHLSLHEHNEQIDKAIGVSSLQKIIDNIRDDTGIKINPNLPDADELNRILRYVGIGNQSIEDYKGIFKENEKNFHQISMAITSIAGLLNVLGLHADKIAKKDDADAKYPIYHKKSFRTIRSGYYDNDHLSFASRCTYFVTTDTTLYEKAKEIYGFLGIETIPVLLDKFMDMQIEFIKQ